MEKNSGEVKGRLAYNGKPAIYWIFRDDKFNTTALTEGILIAAAIDAKEEIDVASIYFLNAFIQVHVPLDLRGERIVMKVRGVLVNWLIQLNTVAYSQYIVYKNGKKLFYLEVFRDIYRKLFTSLLW